MVEGREAEIFWSSSPWIWTPEAAPHPRSEEVGDEQSGGYGSG